MSDNLVIAHRGTTFYAPEESEAAMRWARNVGADYLEFDLQRTKDGYLIALHDEKLTRTTDVKIKFPDRQNDPVSSFTYEELVSLDIGKWFNIAYPERAKQKFIGLDILTLEDISQIAEGNKIKKDENNKRIISKDKNGRIISHYEKDLSDNGNRPGMYIETKIPDLFPLIEKDLRRELERLGWYSNDSKNLKKIKTFKNKVKIANTSNRIILQTFSKESLHTLHTVFSHPIPICFLLWRGSDKDDIPTDSLITFEDWIKFGKMNGASIIGPSIGGEPNNYVDLLTESHYNLIIKHGLKIHAYSFDTEKQIHTYSKLVHGMFSNKAEQALLFYKNELIIADTILNELGY